MHGGFFFFWIAWKDGFLNYRKSTGAVSACLFFLKEDNKNKLLLPDPDPSFSTFASLHMDRLKNAVDALI